jgi:type IV fimbrial biogenesis protein FimT
LERVFVLAVQVPSVLQNFEKPDLASRFFDQRRFPMNRHAGLTLIELAVTIAVFAVLCALSVPQMISWRSRARMNDAALKVLALFQNARMLAVKENAGVWVYCRASGNSCDVFVDNGPEECRDNGLQDAGEPVVRGVLPPGVTIEHVTRSPLKFNSRGIPYFGTVVRLADGGGRRKQVVVSPSGHSRISS